MRTLIVFAHPNPKSFSAAIFESITTLLAGKNDEYKVSNLYEMNFNPVLSGADFMAINRKTYCDDVLLEMQKINWAERIIFIYPLWWAGMPAIMKGYIDRVMAKGYAYDYVNRSLKPLLEKKAFIINTMGTPNEYYNSIGMTHSMQMVVDKGIFEMCGIKVEHHIFLGSVPTSTNEEREHMLSQISKLF